MAPASRYVALIGDIVASRELEPAQRNTVQRTLQEFLIEANASLSDALAAEFAITAGDEFEALIHREAAANVIPDLIWQVEETFSDLMLRLGIGYGAIDTEISGAANTVDGPAFHAARAAIEQAAKDKLLGGVFRGFGERNDAVLNGIARLLQFQRARWSPQQRRLAEHLRRGLRQVDAVAALGISKQAVSDYAERAGWDAYAEGETALRAALEQSTTLPFPDAPPDPKQPER